MEEAVFHNPWPPRRAVNHPLEHRDENSSMLAKALDESVKPCMTLNGDDPSTSPTLDAVLLNSSIQTPHLGSLQIDAASQ